jgi:hypothetical protein
MSHRKISIAEHLNLAQVAIHNTLDDDELLSPMAEYGYTAERVHEGRQLYEAAVAAVNAQKMAAGNQRDATAQLRAARAAAQDAYVALSQIARACLARPQLDALGLRGRVPRSTAGFLAGGYALFDNAQSVPEIQAALAQLGYTRARLQSERDKIAAVERANQAQAMAKGAAQQATQDQDAALAAMNEWLARYLRVARVALRGQKPLLEKIGIMVRMTKTAAQRAGPAKAAATRAARKEVQTG